MTARRGGLVLGAICGLAVSLIFIGGFVAGAAFDRHQVDQTVDMSDPNIQSFLSAYRLVTQHSYYRPFDKQKLLFAAIDGMLGATGDPHTIFLSPTENKRANTQLDGSAYTGIGAIVQPVGGRIEILTPISGAPASRAGLHSHDLISAVNGRSLAGVSGEAAVASVEGKPGSTVHLTILRGHQRPFIVAVRRATIPPITAYGWVLAHHIGYLRLVSFGDTTSQQTAQTLHTLARAGIRGIVIDLRGNPGGLVDAAQRIASDFLGRGVVAYEEMSNRQLTALPVLAGRRIVHVPIAILVDGGTASASEILASALRDEGQAVLLGSRTYGKGSMQSVYQLANGSTMRLTDRLWLTPRKRSVNHVGLTPVVTLQPASGYAGPETDPQVLAAERYLLTHGPA